MVLPEIEAAQAAAQQGDWDRVIEILREQLQVQRGKQQTWQPEVRDSLLEIALQALDVGDFSTRWFVAKLLPALGNGAIAPLIAIVEDEETDSEERWFAARLLGEFRDPTVIDVLVTMCQKSATAHDTDLASMAAYALANHGTAAVMPLTTLLSHPSACPLAVNALSQIPDTSVIAPLLSVTNHEDSEIRAAALLALSNFRDERILALLCAAVGDTSSVVRRSGAIGLGRLAKPALEATLLPVLTPLLTDLQLAVCEQAAIAIGRLKTEEAVRALAATLNDPLTPPLLQTTLIRALVWTELPLALTCLRQALCQLPVPSQREIIQVLSRVPPGELQSQAVDIMLAFWNARAIEAENLSPSILQGLAHGWELLQDPRAIPALLTLQKHPDPQVRIHADSALVKLTKTSKI